MNKEEREEALREMSVASRDFYNKAVSIRNHPFIEFAGLINEYINMCQAAHEKDIDFSDCNTHTGKDLPMELYQRNYINEKLECIFTGRSFIDPKEDKKEDGRKAQLFDWLGARINYVEIQLSFGGRHKAHVECKPEKLEAEIEKAKGFEKDSDNMKIEEPRFIKGWEDLAALPPSETHVLEISLENNNGWIKEKNAQPGKPRMYLSTHTFYGSTFARVTKQLQECGFNVQLDNWDAKESEAS